MLLTFKNVLILNTKFVFRITGDIRDIDELQTNS
jgi:hypothetical protein